MTISKNKTGKSLIVNLSGRLDTATAPLFEAVINNEINDVEELIIDLKELEYISSAGLRILLLGQKIMNKQGKMEILNANDYIKEIFDITGFKDILTIK